MGYLSNPHVQLDAWLLLGAVLQCVVILRARRFEAGDWLLPLFLLIGGSFAWFGFITLASSVPDAANAFIVGFALAMGGAAVFVADSAPARLSAAALVSLTVTFWVVYGRGDFSRIWLIPAIPMTALAAFFAYNPKAMPLSARFGLQIWSLTAAALVASDGVPARVADVLKDYRVAERAHTLAPLEILITGAQFFLFFLMLVGVIVLMEPRTWRGWLPSNRDQKLSWPALVAVTGQAAVLIWARGQDAEIQGRLLSLSVLAALAHGAMNGDDAGTTASVDPEMRLRLDDRDRQLIENVGRTVWGVMARAFAVIAVFAAVVIWLRWRKL